MIETIRNCLLALAKLPDESLGYIYKDNEELFNICLLRFGVPIPANSLSGLAARYAARDAVTPDASDGGYSHVDYDFPEFDVYSNTSRSSASFKFSSTESSYSGGESTGSFSSSYDSYCTQSSSNSSFGTNVSAGEQRKKPKDKFLKAKRFLDKLWEANTFNEEIGIRLRHIGSVNSTKLEINI